VAAQLAEQAGFSALYSGRAGRGAMLTCESLEGRTWRTAKSRISSRNRESPNGRSFRKTDRHAGGDLMDTKGIDNLLGQMRVAAALASGKPQSAQAAGGTGGADFAAVLKNSIENVNQVQSQARTLAQDFELGKPNVNLQDVMISLSKANIAFQEMVQVRNRVVSAYHDVMNMQV
jgi:flagellar hook-basal body complex protein FliE